MVVIVGFGPLYTSLPCVLHYLVYFTTRAGSASSSNCLATLLAWLVSLAHLFNLHSFLFTWLGSMPHLLSSSISNYKQQIMTRYTIRECSQAKVVTRNEKCYNETLDIRMAHYSVGWMTFQGKCCWFGCCYLVNAKRFRLCQEMKVCDCVWLCRNCL